MPQIRFTVIGKPQTAGSKRAFVRGGRPIVVDDNPKQVNWQGMVAQMARQAYDGELLDGPLLVQMLFFFPRPKGHFGTGRNAGVLKATAPKQHTTKPDVLKLARATEDALTGVVYRDDAQIVCETLSKHYGVPTRAEIIIEPCKETPDA